MEKYRLLAIVFTTVLLQCNAFYKESEFDKSNMATVRPTNIEDLKKALCKRVIENQCVDREKRKIVLSKVFDFTTSEGVKENYGCIFQKTPKNCKTSEGQVKLRQSGNCNGLKQTMIKYNIAGIQGLHIGSNKVISCIKKNCGIKGKGLKLKNVYNIEILNLVIKDINPKMISGGNAIELTNVRNVLIQKCTIRNVGDYMVLSQGKGSIGVTLASNTFLGETAHSPTCDRQHNWLWQFNGEGDMIALENNVVLSFHGPCLRINAANNAKSHIYLNRNKFSGLSKNDGVIELTNEQSSIFGERNKFEVPTKVVEKSIGAISLPVTCIDENNCMRILGRVCGYNVGVPVVGERLVRQNMIAMVEHKRVMDYINGNVIITDLANMKWAEPATVASPSTKQLPRKSGGNGGPSINRLPSVPRQPNNLISANPKKSLGADFKALLAKLLSLLQVKTNLQKKEM